MSHRGRRNADSVLAAHLAAGKTHADAAAAVGLHVRTVGRRWANPKFRLLVSRLRGEMTDRAAGQLADAMTDATRKLRELLDCKSPTVQLGACRAILELAARARESSEYDARLRVLEERESAREGRGR